MLSDCLCENNQAGFLQSFRMLYEVIEINGNGLFIYPLFDAI